MYENRFTNKNETGPEELNLLLRLMADLDVEIELFAIGGTAMVMASIKAATRDIDFLTPMEYNSFRAMMERAGLKEDAHSSALCGKWHIDSVRMDIFFGEMIMGIPLSTHWRKKSQHIKKIGKISLNILDWEDIIITKIARSEERDVEDIIAIIKHENLDAKKIKEHYYARAETALIQDYDVKFKYLEKRLS